MKSKDISGLYMTDLIHAIGEDYYTYRHREGELVAKFQHAHMSVRPDENRITLEDITELVTTLIGDEHSHETSFAFNIIEAMITSIVNNGDYAGQLMLSNVPEYPVNVLFALFTPVKELTTTETPSWFAAGYSISLIKDIIDYHIPTEWAENLITTITRCFSVGLLLCHMNDMTFLKERWKEALASNNIGAGVTYFNIVAVATMIWDLYSNRETRKIYFTDWVFYKATMNIRLQLLKQQSDVIEDNIPQGGYFLNALQCGAIQAIEGGNFDMIKEIMEEFCFSSLRDNQSRLSYMIPLLKTAISNVTCSTSTQTPEVYKKLFDVWDEVVYKYFDNHTESSCAIFGKNSDFLRNTYGEENVDPMEALKEIPGFNDDMYSEDVDSAMEAVHKDSPKINAAGKKIYKAYRTYKGAEEKIDSQLTKAATSVGKMVIGDTRKEVIEGKHYTVLGVLKRALGTVALFSTGKIRAIIALVIRHALRKKSTESEKRKVIMELQTEIDMITEKIEDARGDNNREAKYAMMRTKKDLENALKRVQYGMEADTKTIQGAKNALNNAR